MDLKIKDLKIGERLIFGKYGVKNDTVYPISWLKCTPNCDFITEFVLDCICFDADEPNNTDYRSYGNSNYSVSNIFTFINSAEENWYFPRHPLDAPPDGYSLPYLQRYKDHCGFLYNFEEYEIESLVEIQTTIGDLNISSIVRLPSIENFSGDIDRGRFDLFKKKGWRAKGTDDLITSRNMSGYDSSSFIPFWLRDDSSTTRRYAPILDRSCNKGSRRPRDPSGLRPVCTIAPETPVILGEDGHFYIQPRHVVRNVYTNEELFELLGLTRP